MVELENKPDFHWQKRMTFFCEFFQTKTKTQQKLERYEILQFFQMSSET